MAWLDVPGSAGGGLSKPGGIIVGEFYDGYPMGWGSTTAGHSPNRIDMAPLLVPKGLSIDQLGASVTSAGASGTQSMKMLIYNTGEDGWPDELVLATGDIDVSGTGYAYDTVDFDFEDDVQYWGAVWADTDMTVRAGHSNTSWSLGLMTSHSNSYAKFLRRTETYGTPPDPWAFTGASELTSGSSPSVRFRAQ